MTQRYSIILVLPFLLLLAFLYVIIDSDSKNSGTINAVIGDESYLQLHGELPDMHTPDSIRIQTHLNYVVGFLRNRPTDHLTTEQETNRQKYLDLLKKYIAKGEFPHNDGHPDNRRPTFVSENGHICAVGWLVKQTYGPEIIQEINKEYKYDYIQDIDHPDFQEWVDHSGFTIEELAMIQPMYGPIITEEVKENRNHISRSYAVGTTLSIGSNALYMSNSSGNPWILDSPRQTHWFGLAAGTASVVLGVLNVNNAKTYTEPEIQICWVNCTVKEVTQTNHLRTGVAASTIAVGLVSMTRAGYHLLRGSDKATKQPSGLGVTALIAAPKMSDEVVPALTYSIRF
tara:strand:- start:10573 stop:11601 length:1029 start_codon:yes stop_codon:yes gene_type:complete